MAKMTLRVNEGSGMVVGSDNQQADDTVDLSELLRALWSQRLLIACCIVIGLAASVLYLHNARYLYTAYLRVVPAQSSAGSGRSSGLASLASIAGLGSLQDPSTLSFQLYTEGLHSRAVAEAMARDQGLMREIFKAEWDARARSFAKPKQAGLGKLISGVKSILGFPPRRWLAPGASRMQEFIEKNVKVRKDPESPVVTITLDNENPGFAISFLTALHAELDRNLRTKALDRANQYIVYLSNQLRIVTLAEHRSAIADALSEQEKNRMMASSSVAFAADMFGPVVSSPHPTRPQPIMVLALGILIGATVGALVAFFRANSSMRRRRPAD